MGHRCCPLAAHWGSPPCEAGSIKTCLSGVRYFHIKAGVADPFQGAVPRLDYIMRGIKKNEARMGEASRDRPITPDFMRRLKEVWSASGDSPDTKMIWAACCLCIFGFLRAGELTVPSDTGFDPSVHLCVSDLALDDSRCPSLLRVSTKQSKTDPFRHGVHLFLGRTGTGLCPVAAVLDFLKARGGEPGPLFRFRDGSPLTRQRFVERVREALRWAGVDQSK